MSTLNIEFEKVFSEKDFERFLTYVKERSAFFKSLQLEHKFSELENEIENEKTLVSYYVKKEYSKKSISFVFGRYVGLLDILYEQLSEHYSHQLFEDYINACAISEIPHINDIITVIQQNDGIRHGILAEKVGIDKSTLTGIMDRLVDKKVVVFSRPGKYKYYYLSEFGKTFYEKNKKQMEVGTNIDALIEQLLLCLSKEKNATDKLLQIITVLCKGQSAFSGYNSKPNGNVDLDYIFATIPSIKPVNVILPASQQIHRINQGFTWYINEEDPFVILTDNGNQNFLEKRQQSVINYI